MDGPQTTANGLASVEATLRDELAQGDAALSAATPLLQRLLAHHDPGLINDEVVARVRGMLAEIARQLLEASGQGDDASGGRLVEALVRNDALVTHLHALALEGRLADRLEADAGIDPVLSPLLEGLIAGGDEVLAGAAMAAMSAQSGFIGQQRRMVLPLGELPGELFQAALAALREIADVGEGAEAALRRGIGEGRGRLDLLNRLVMRTGSNAPGVLEVERAGLGVFLTALSLAAGLERDAAVMSLASRQPARLALALRSAGLTPAAVEAQVLQLRPDVTLPGAVARLGADQAANILASAALPGSR
jgi:hypothetical protein